MNPGQNQRDREKGSWVPPWDSGKEERDPSAQGPAASIRLPGGKGEGSSSSSGSATICLHSVSPRTTLLNLP